jgi:hypothetical protein
MNILNYTKKLFNRLSSSGTLEVDRDEPVDISSKENSPSSPPITAASSPLPTPAPKDLLILNSYIKSAPHPQNALDIFQGEWSSKLPKPLEDAQAGAALLFDDPRLKWFINEIGGVQGKSVLELGPLEGGHTYLLEKLGAESIIAIEANTRSFLKCLVVKELLHLQKSHFLCGDFIEYLGQEGTNFEICIASGVLYHMQNPVELIARIANRCPQYIFLWTHYYDSEIITANPNLTHKFGEVIQRECQGFPHQLYRQEYKSALGWSGFCGGSAPISYWMTRNDILDCLRYFGFDDLRISYDQPDHPNGPSFAITGIRKENSKYSK